MEYGKEQYVFIHEACDGVISTKEFEDKPYCGEVIKEFTYFLKGLGFAEETIEEFIPYFEV